MASPKNKLDRIGDNQRSLRPVSVTTAQEAQVFDQHVKERHWLNPIAMSSLKRAVQEKRKVVILNGDEFSIQCDYVWRSKLVDPYECVVLRRTDGSGVPFGYVSMKRILAFEFEDDDK